jgi:hypothetical protein
MRWPNENAYDGIIATESARTGVSMALIKAVIGLESEYNPRAVRAEAPRASLPPTPDFPQGGDMSVGLMQLLVRTARLLRYTGPVGDKQLLTGLYDPATNVHLGTLLLRDNVNTAKAYGLGVDAAISAYNGGWRPALGYGKPLPSGLFANQAYVNVVLKNMAYFGATPEELMPSAPVAVPTVPLDPTLPTDAPDPASATSSYLPPASSFVPLQPLPGGMQPISDSGGAGPALAMLGAALALGWLVLQFVDRRER